MTRFTTERAAHGQRVAALRDASWWQRPNTSSVKRYHVVAADGLAAVCGAVPVLDVDGAVPAAEVAPGLRCRRRACAAAFVTAQA